MTCMDKKEMAPLSGLKISNKNPKINNIMSNPYYYLGKQSLSLLSFFYSFCGFDYKDQAGNLHHFHLDVS